MRRERESSPGLQARILRLKGRLLAAGATAIGAGAIAASSLTISPATSEPLARDVGGCPQIILYFSRGSGQDLDTNAQRRHEQLYGGQRLHELGLANPGFQLFEALITKYGERNIGAVANAYPAVSVTPPRPRAYLASVDQGVSSADRNITDLVRLCPRSKLVLGGFSQGAQVIHTALPNLTAGEQEHIAAVTLFGDPYFRANDPVVKPERSANPKRDANPAKRGIAYYAFSKRSAPMIGGTYKGKVFSWCHLFDPVCQSVDVRHPWRSLKGLAGHKAYAEEIGAATRAIADRLRASSTYPTVAPPTTTGAPPTSAPHGYHVTNTCHGGTCGVAEWSGPGTASYEPIGALHEHQLVEIACQITGEAVTGANGGASAIWDRLSEGAFVADYYLSTPGIGKPTKSIPKCEGLTTGSP